MDGPAGGAQHAHEPAKDSKYLLDEAEFRKGDVAAGLAGAAQRIEQTYVQPSRHNNPMEPSATLAEWDGDRLTVHDAVQHGYSAQAVLAMAFGLQPGQVRVVCPHTGGGFGSKGYVWPHQALAAAAARVVGRPVKLVLSRSQMYSNVGYQPRMVQAVALGADAGGRLAAIRHDVVNVTGVSDDFVEFATAASKAMYAQSGHPNLTARRAVQRQPAHRHAGARGRPGHLGAGQRHGRAGARAPHGPARLAPRQLRRGRPGAWPAVVQQEAA